MKKFLYKRMLIWLSAPIGALLVLLAKLDNGWIERFFIPFVYKPLATVIGSVVALFPFSVTEVLVVLAVAGLIYYITRVVIKICKTHVWKRPIYKMAVNAVCVASLAFFLFEICMGLNYYRDTVTEHIGLEVKQSTTEELYTLCEILVDDMNECRAKLETDKNGVAQLSDTDRTATSDSARDAYKKLSDKYTFLKSANIRNKPLVSSKLFSAVLTTGIYIPYTFESNINIDVPEHTIPATMCHELTHYRGFMREDEANFLSYLACMESDRADFKYSGSVMAFGYCYTALYNDNPDLAKRIANMCDDGIITDIVAEDAYWEGYRNTVVSDVSTEVYDNYLNFNNVESGIKSYGEMVDLMLAYYRN